MTTLSPTLQLAIDLIERPSITPLDCGCQALLGERLEAIGFELTPLHFAEVDNLWAQRNTAQPLLVLAGHTDVVPPGDEAQWLSPPFQHDIREGYLYGRGTADMKGSLAAMVTACERFINKHPQHKGSLAFLITSDEEGPSINGTVKVVEWLQAQQQTMTWCIVGEPSSSQQVGDVVKNGRRGSLSGTLTVHGTQGHVAYPHLADNPIHRSCPALSELCARQWDQGNAYFPATTFQISNINAGTGANNVIPGAMEILFNFRYSTETNHEILRQQVETILDRHQLNYTINWHLSGKPFITNKGDLTDAVSKAIKDTNGLNTELSTAGGTSDGRFIAPTGTQVIELGPVNATIHKINECVSIKDLDQLTLMYEKVMENLLL